MAANSRNAIAIATFGKRITNQIWTTDPLHFSFRRAPHTSAYDKNPDDEIRPSAEPNEVTPPQPDKYWAPHPQTGVFGPVTGDATAASLGNRGLHAAKSDGSEFSVEEEEKAWFRPTSLEDSEKPHAY